ncbi:MAG: type III secretion system export apparatus subunit SctS [Lentisphaeria bacterium]|nr:type III secretion system export apparatus subunit SctS [Lentisphaeria bacterium]
MDQAQILDYAKTCMILILKVSLIQILVATVVGLIESVLQALTQIHEQTLGFAVKLITITITLMVTSSWMGAQILLYTRDIFQNFPLLH